MKRFKTLIITGLLLLVAAWVFGAGQWSPLFTKKQPGGIYGVINTENGTGDIWYVDDGGTDGAGYGRNPISPVATTDYAIGLATAGTGDTIYVMPGHAETVTSAITVDKAGLHIKGIGAGRNIPAITGNGKIDAITITAANVTIDNLYFPAPSSDNQTSDINIAAAGVTIRNTRHIGSTTSKNKTDVITITAAGDDYLIDGVEIYNQTVDCVSAISMEGATDRGVIQNSNIQGQFSTAAVMVETGFAPLLIQLRNNVIKNDKAATAVLQLSNLATGVLKDNSFSGRHTTLASNITSVLRVDFFENRLVEEGALNGAIYPAADAD